MKHIKNMVKKAIVILPALAMFFGVIASNSACMCYFYQPETPAAMNAYRK